MEAWNEIEKVIAKALVARLMTTKNKIKFNLI